MAKDIFISGNYVIVIDDKGYLRDFPMGKTVITETATQFIIKEGQIEGSEIPISFTDAVNWKNEHLVPYSVATLRTFLRENTANFSSGGVSTFIGLTDTPSSFVGQANKWLRVNAGADAVDFIDEIETYKTTWKTLPVFNGSYGLANTGNVAYRPKIKIINRTVYMTGIYVLPQPTTAGGNILDTNGALYTLQSRNFSDLYLSASDGFTIDSKNQGITSNPILPTALRPQEHARIQNSKGVMSKTKNITGGRMRLNAWLDQMTILSDGRLYLRSMEANERNGDVGTGWNRNNQARTIVSKFNIGDKLMNFDNFRNAFDNGGLDTLRDPNVEGFTFDYSMDGNRTNYFGGFVPEFSVSYPLNDSYTIAQIKSAFDAL